MQVHSYSKYTVSSQNIQLLLMYIIDSSYETPYEQYRCTVAALQGKLPSSR